MYLIERIFSEQCIYDGDYINHYNDNHYSNQDITITAARKQDAGRYDG